jgi:glycosyltransferase involved in cell wall biosynthesis
MAVQLVNHNQHLRAKAKVVRIIGRLNVGGPARQACFLHQALEGDFETVLVAGRLDRHEGDMSYLLSSENGVYWVPSMSRSVRLWRDFFAFFRILHILIKEKPEIVHTHTAKAGALGRLAAAIIQVPVRVHTYHGHVFHSYFGPVRTRLWLAIERALNRLTTRTIAISEAQANELTERYHVVPASRLLVIPNGYDLSPFAAIENREQGRILRRTIGFDDSHFVVLWAGRLVPVKNIELLAEIVRRATHSPKLRFLIVGDGSERRRLESLTAACPNLHMLGWRNDMPVLCAAADAALVTSRNEGTPTVLIEAMASGKPFVSTNVGGTIDLASPPTQMDSRTFIITAGNGFLTPSEPDPIVECLEFLASNPASAAAMGQAGRSFALGRWGHDHLLNELRNMYRTLLTSQGRARNCQFPASFDQPEKRPTV